VSAVIRALGAAGTVYRDGAVRAYALSAETSETCVLLTDVHYPVGESGDCVFRRIYIPLLHEAGLSLTITPIIDGTSYPQHARVVNRNGAGRETIYLPLAVRGTSIQLSIVSAAPTGRWSIENRMFVYFTPGLGAARDTTAVQT